MSQLENLEIKHEKHENLLLFFIHGTYDDDDNDKADGNILNDDHNVHLNRHDAVLQVSIGFPSAASEKEVDSLRM